MLRGIASDCVFFLQMSIPVAEQEIWYGNEKLEGRRTVRTGMTSSPSVIVICLRHPMLACSMWATMNSWLTGILPRMHCLSSSVYRQRPLPRRLHHPPQRRTAFQRKG